MMNVLGREYTASAGVSRALSATLAGVGGNDDFAAMALSRLECYVIFPPDAYATPTSSTRVTSCTSPYTHLPGWRTLRPLESL